MTQELLESTMDAIGMMLSTTLDHVHRLNSVLEQYLWCRNYDNQRRSWPRWETMEKSRAPFESSPMFFEDTSTFEECDAAGGSVESNDRRSITSNLRYNYIPTQLGLH
jgi:hypothetical protein